MRRLKYEGFIAEKTEKSVRVIHQSPREDYIIASGLESGDIQLWNVLLKTEPLSIYQGTDRVFALDFSKDSGYLFSGHGSGFVRKWNLEFPNSKPQIANSRFTISALAISESREKQPNVLAVIAGRYNKLSLWDWFNRRIYELEYFSQNWQEDKKFSPTAGQNQYINSLALADDQNLLASSDNQGYISLWDMDKIRQCINNTSAAIARNSDRTRSKTDGLGNLVIPLDCDNAIIDRWHQGQENQPVRSAALSQNGCYVVSGGDDGRVILWPLENGKRSPQYQAGKIIAEFPGVRINSVDIKALDDNLFISTGDDKNRVKLYRVNGSDENNNANCQ
jgi:WD40 repeat protein